jgi:uncharacterized protein
MKIRLAAASLILAIGMIISAGVISKFFVRVRHEQSISVKGYAEQFVVSDFGRMVCRYRVRGSSLKDAYSSLQAARDTVTAALKSKGFSDTEISIENVDTAKIARRDAEGREMNEIEFIDLSQSITIESTNVTLIKTASISMADLIKDGIDLTIHQPDFYITNLKETKLDLLSRATEDGYQRAVKMASKGHGAIGGLTSAEQGVFQITTRNSTETSGYGVYDTSTIEKR